MIAVGRRIVAPFLRFYLRRRSRAGKSLVAMLPEAALMPLKRVGLDPVAEMGELREQEPVHRLQLPFGIKAWLVTGYEESKAVLGAPDAFSSDFTNLVGTLDIGADQNPGGLGFSDPPDHTRLRHILTPEFTVRRLARLAPRITAIVEGQLEEMAEVAARDGVVDLMQHFALPIPSLMMCELLGIPYEDRAEFQRLSTARFDFLGGPDGTFGSISESLVYLREVVARERTNPGEGMLGQIVRDHGSEISDEELAGLADGLLTGGLETTTSMLALGAIVLLEQPDVRARLIAGDEGVAEFVDELLRYLTVVQVAFPRVARRDVEVGEHTIGAGDIVLCSLSAANRDPRTGPGAESFDPARKSPAHLAFGWGIHRCVGAELARMELRAAYPALIRRFPGITLAKPGAELPYRELSFVYGVDELPVRL